MQIAVIGAGIIGLATAYMIRQAGHDVHVIGETFSPNTVSDLAAAIWKPYATEESARVGAWAAKTLRILLQHALNPAAGAIPTWVNQLGETKLPWWAAFMPQQMTKIYQTNIMIGGKELPSYRFQSILADMSIYMPWLMAECKTMGIQFSQKSVDDVQDILPDYDAVIICTGNNKKLYPDDELLKPLSGVVLIYPTRLTEESWSNYAVPGEPTYINPRRNQTIVGGTSLPPEEVTDEIISHIRMRAAKILPNFPMDIQPRIVYGNRPYRPIIRFEKTQVNGKPVIYNYGHGGAGVTLSWGCAAEIVTLLAI